MMRDQTGMRWKKGGCHCGRVAFEALLPDDVEALDCNCSICVMTGYLHVIVPKDRFRLVQGGDAYLTYRFNTKTAQHLFCGTCGVKPFYVPRSHPDAYSVNARCLDGVRSLRISAFDGQNWEREMQTRALEGTM